MPLFQRYLLKELLQCAVITFGVITIITMTAGSLQFLHKAPAVSLPLLMKAVAGFVISQLGMTLPLTVLVASVMTYGRAAADNEINSMRAAGVHLYTAFAPALLFGLLGTALVLHVNDRVAPRLSLTRAMLLEHGLDVIEATLERGENVIGFDKENYLVVRDRDPETGLLIDVRYKKYTEDDDAVPLEHEFSAETARFTIDHKAGQLVLEAWNVRSLHGSGEDTNAEYMSWPIRLGEESQEKKLSQYTLSELVAAIPRRFEGAKKAHSIRTEYHQRVASAFACLLFVLIGVPLSIIFKHGNRMVAFLISFMIALVGYYPMFILGEVLAEEVKLVPIVAAWSGTAVLGLLGVGLTAIVFRR